MANNVIIKWTIELTKRCFNQFCGFDKKKIPTTAKAQSTNKNIKYSIAYRHLINSFHFEMKRITSEAEILFTSTSIIMDEKRKKKHSPTLINILNLNPLYMMRAGFQEQIGVPNTLI